MNKIKFNLPAFSLAEALITLLIVCLITLASIPVLTKKKRSVNEFASGKWMCTLNSKGQYVTYSSSDPYGDIKDPETWRVSQNATSCTFLPPQNGKNYVVTVIGGGGGGHDGVSQQVDYITPTTLSKNIIKEGLYKVAVIGGGGGGHGSDDHDGGIAGVGGQGGAGGHFVGAVKFPANTNLTASIGKGGQGCKDDGAKAQWCTFGGGGPSTLSIGGTNFITAFGGGGAQSTKSGNKPKAGEGGNGGNVSINNAFKSYIVNSYSSYSTGSKGAQFKHCGAFATPDCPTGQIGSEFKIISGPNTGEMAEYGKYNNYNCYGIHNGTILGDFYNNQDSYEYGRGGFGCRHKKSTGMTGSNGIVRVWQTEIQAGEGGKAAKLAIYSIPSIKNKVVVNIGLGGNANEKGAMTVASIYNKDGNVERELRGDGGDAGSLGEISLDHFVLGSQGENSNWLIKGGGTVGTCSDSRYEKVETTQEQEIIEYKDGVPICLIGVYYLGSVYANPTSYTNFSYCPLNDTTTVKGFCVGCDWSQDGECAFKQSSFPNEDHQYIGLDDKAKKYLDLMYNVEQNQEYVTYKAYFSKFIIDKWDPYKSWQPGRMYTYTGLENDYDCLKYKTRKTTVTKEVLQYIPAGCDDSGNGTYFGSGGGGGSTTDYIGHYGHGGKGAPGAVVIEW